MLSNKSQQVHCSKKHKGMNCATKQTLYKLQNGGAVCCCCCMVVEGMHDLQQQLVQTPPASLCIIKSFDHHLAWTRVWGLGLFLITILSNCPNLADDTLQQVPGIAGPHIHNKSLDFCFNKSGFGSSACTRGSAQGTPDVELYRPWAWRGHVVSCESKLFREICMIFNGIDLHFWKNWKSSLNWVCVIFNSRDRNSFFAFYKMLRKVCRWYWTLLCFVFFCVFFNFPLSSFCNEDHSCFVVASKSSCRNVLWPSHNTNLETPKSPSLFFSFMAI